MNARERFLNAANGRAVDRHPIWLMRQAGRYLPEYRALRARHGFLEMVHRPELAAEVTLQPLRRFALDAGIIFSDILTVPEALGVGFDFREGGGIQMQRAVRTRADVEALRAEEIIERLEYVYAALRQVKRALGGERALLGFAGAPWTLAAYLVEGQSRDGFPALLSLAGENPDVLEKLLEILSAAVAAHLQGQIAAGADAVQLFDSWGAICPTGLYERFSLKWVRKIVTSLPKETPVIYYAKGVACERKLLWESGARVLGFDEKADMAKEAALAPEGCAVQGNLDNRILLEGPERSAAAARALLEGMGHSRGYIFNLGHGVLPGTMPESVEAVVKTVCEFRIA